MERSILNRVLVLGYRPDLARACIRRRVGATFIVSARTLSLSERIEHDLISYVLVSSTKNFEEILCKVSERNDYPYDTVFAENEDAVVRVEALKSLFSIDKGNPKDLSRYRSKFIQKRSIGDVPRARCERVAEDLPSDFDYPVVLKPEYGSATELTSVVRNPDELRTTIKRNPTLQFVVESFIDFPEYYVDGWIDEEGGVHDVVLSKYSEPVLKGISSDLGLNGYVVGRDELHLYEIATTMMTKVSRSLGVKSRVFHCEAFLDLISGEFIFSEIGFRFGGAFIPEVYESVTGLSLYDLSLLLACERSSEAKELSRLGGGSDKLYGWSFIKCRPNLVVEKLPSVDDVNGNVDGLLKVRIELKEGEKTPEMAESSVHRAALVLACAENLDGLNKVFRESQAFFDDAIKFVPSIV